ncbi:Gfo/Idh/MocA family protein [Cohnella thermotolerans]|uniref:Gfo/Idh/MocA family protein n=1 Tax=Cohnella thermotolerans TaxID=329858 RepID=UPI00040BBDDD|nr:Gfo/Idh/MocA family oxidoreductase [Cohnella thermotolerans]
MKKIGFIDYFLDEWHAEHYPAWIERASAGAASVVYAYGKTDSPNGRSNAEWCSRHGIRLLPSIEELVDASDAIVVLSPDHPEQHEELSRLALQSGKPTYVDKTFAPDRMTAQAMFARAREHGTPLYSCSALRFADEYAGMDRQGIENVCSIGPGSFNHYAIHQIEPIVSLMGGEPTRVMSVGTPNAPALLIGFADGRQAAVHQMGWDCPFQIAVAYTSGQAKVAKPESDYFDRFVRKLLAFFETGEPEVPEGETIAIVTVIEYGLRAMAAPYQWVQLPHGERTRTSENGGEIRRV